MINQDVLDTLRGRLLDEQGRLLQSLDTLRGGGELAPTFLADESDAVDQHSADEGSELFEREKNMALDREIDSSLQQVREALARWDAGTYGMCMRCGNPIPEKRLQALPEALYDIQCQSIVEHGRITERHTVQRG